MIPYVQAMDELEAAVNSTAALLEVLTELHKKSLEPSGMDLMSDTVVGLNTLAKREGANLRERFDDLSKAATARRYRAG